MTSADPGYKKATFTLTLKPKKMSTKAQGQKVLKAFKGAYYDQGGAGGNERATVWTYWMRGGLGYWLVDYKTGKNLEDPNNAAGVKAESKVSYGKARKYETSDGKWSFTQLGVIKVKATVTFPEDYEDLCVCVGGDMWPRIERTKSDESFEGKYFKFAGDKAYTARWWQTSRFKKANGNFHFMRIR